MKRLLMQYTGLCSLILVLSACGSSPPSNHYLLTARPANSPGGETPALGIGPIAIPEYLNRNGLVYKRQGNQLQVSSTERWAEPLEDGIKRVISLNLASLQNTHNVRFFPWNPQRAPDYGIKVNLLSLDANDQQATLVAEWLVYRPATGATVSRRISQLHHPLAGDALSPQQIAPAYSDLLYQLSEIISTAISADDKASPDEAASQ